MKIGVKEIVIIILAIALILSLIFRPSKVVDNHQDEINSLKKQNELLLYNNDSIKSQNEILSQEIKEILITIDSTEAKLADTEIKLNSLEHEKSKVFNRVRNLNALWDLEGNSQTTSTEKNRVTTYINEVGDTMITMSYEDARTILEDVLNYEYTDSLLTVYKERDSLNIKTITLQKKVLMKMGQEKQNLQQMLDNFEEIVSNKNTEIELKEDTIKQQKKEIRKQKTLKLIGFAGSIILPIITVLLIL